MKASKLLIIVCLMTAAMPLHAGVLAPQDPIESIRQHYAEINKNVASYRRVKKDLTGFSGEGGQLVAYFHGPSVMKMVTTFFGETGRATEEYYYWNGKLIFVLRTEQNYDKPLSGKVVKTAENRFYFNEDVLVRWLNEAANQVASDSQAFSEKQKEYLHTSRQLLAGARSDKLTIEAEP